MLQQQPYKIDIPRDKYSMSDIFSVKDLSPYHGDEDFDPRSDLSQGRRDDAEHPSIIPMDSTSTTLAPRGPMTRARAKAIEDKVSSLLSELPLSMHETWLLPKSELLCMIRYQEDPPEDAREDGQDPKSVEEENPWKKARTASRHRTSGQDPGHPSPGDLHGQPSTEETTVTGHPASSPDIRPPPEIRPKSRTSGTGVQGA